MRTTRVAASCLLLLLGPVGGCHREPQPSTAPATEVYSIHVEPASLTLPAGTRAQLAAEARGTDGAAIGGAPLSFVSADPRIAAVTPTGVVTATGATGNTRIEVRSGSGIGTVPVVATAGPPARVEIVEKPQESTTAGETLGGVEVRLVDAHGNPVGAVPVEWRMTAGEGRIDDAATATDARGIARAMWHSGTRAGPQRLEVAGGGVPPVVFIAHTHAGEPASAVLRLLDARSGTPADPVLRMPMSLVVVASDRHGNPAGGAEIVLAADSRCGFPGATVSTGDTGAGPNVPWTPAATGRCRFVATVTGTNVTATLETRVAARR